jgi:RNA polymerase sigma-70 factor, ECF subfamily
VEDEAEPRIDPTVALTRAHATVKNDRPAARDDAFRRLMTEDLPRVHALAIQILGSSTDAEDAVHDAAILAWRRFRSLRDPERFSVWFDRILVNVCRDRLRARRRSRVVDISPGSVEARAREPRNDDPAAAIAEQQALDAVLARLQPDHQVVLALRFGADLSVPAIAERLRVPEGTVKSRLHLALRAIRAELEAEARR